MGTGMMIYGISYHPISIISKNDLKEPYYNVFFSLLCDWILVLRMSQVYVCANNFVYVEK